jgi:hypothetical protein
MEKTGTMKTAFLDTWTESERGWGQRSDGCTIHLSKEDYKDYVENYWAGMPKEVPDEYSRPDNNLREVAISDKLYEQVKKSKNGICLWQTEFRESKDKNEILFKD